MAPLAAFNFYCLCTHEYPEASNHLLSLEGTPFHRCLPSVGVVGGDITSADGSGGMSVYGAPFESENWDMPADRPGLLACVNQGHNM